MQGFALHYGNTASRAKLFPRSRIHIGRLRAAVYWRRGARVESEMIGNRSRIASWATTLAAVGCVIGALSCSQAVAQSDCADGNGVLNMDPPKSMTVPDLIQKFTAEETKVKAARAQYTYTQDLMAQTLGDKGPDGQYHEVTAVSYNAQGKREEKVTFAEQSTLRGINLTKEDMDRCARVHALR